MDKHQKMFADLGFIQSSTIRISGQAPCSKCCFHTGERKRKDRCLIYRQYNCNRAYISSIYTTKESMEEAIKCYAAMTEAHK